MIYVFDLDGTISDANHRLHHITTPGQKKNWGAFFDGICDDEPFHPMVSLIKSLAKDKSSEIILQTGRPENYRKATGYWLKQHGLSDQYSTLLMRQKGDFCDNVTLKLRFLEWIIDHTNTENILWFEDSERVIKAINQQGTLCLSCQHFPGIVIPADHKEIPGVE